MYQRILIISRNYCNSKGLKQAKVEAKGMLAHILREYNISTAQKPEDIKMAYEIVSMPHPKLELQFLPRTKAALNKSEHQM
jgi:hypothetical protein